MSGEHCLFLKGRVGKSSSEEIECDIETYISVFTLVCCEQYDIKLCFVDHDESFDLLLPASVLNLFTVTFAVKENLQIQCQLPAAKAVDGLIVGGLCAVLRWAIKCILDVSPDHQSKSLLGFRGGCLTACSESSIWTNFCEVELPQVVKDMYALESKNLEFSESLKKLESHLKCPVRTHNISRRKLDIIKQMKRLQLSETVRKDVRIADNDNDVISNSAVNSDTTRNRKALKVENNFNLDHSYLEGIDLTLADVMTLPTVHLFMTKSSCYNLEMLNFVIKWYSNMLQEPFIKKAVTAFRWDEMKIEKWCPQQNPDISSCTLNTNSFYSRDRSGLKIKCRNFDPSDIIDTFKKNGICSVREEMEFKVIDWSSLPAELHPSYGDLPGKRIDRKCQQLQSIVGAVLNIASPKQTIVDFCSGGGHVGLLLAYYLPKCDIILVENKEESLRRARKRAANLNLANIRFFQCNLGYFEGSFNIGVSLHACGLSTDLVINKCISEKASFVCCPCCYGKIEDTTEIKFPRSKKFRSFDKLSQDFSMLAHCADRTEANTAKLDQGICCMALIDMDRLSFTNECGYKTSLTTLQPMSCSPKHNLLIGIPC